MFHPKNFHTITKYGNGMDVEYLFYIQNTNVEIGSFFNEQKYILGK